MDMDTFHIDTSSSCDFEVNRMHINTNNVKKISADNESYALQMSDRYNKRDHGNTTFQKNI